MMPAISFDPKFLDALLSGIKQQTTRSVPPDPPKRPRFQVGDIAHIYNQQRRRITEKAVRQMTGAGTTAMADRVNDPKYYYPVACPVVEMSGYGDIPSYYAHLLGKVEITEVYDIHPHLMSDRPLEEWARADGFPDFASARCWFEIRYGARWMHQWFTVIRWDGWLERYFEPYEVIR